MLLLRQEIVVAAEALALIVAVYLTASKMVGRVWAILPVLLIGFSPNFIYNMRHAGTPLETKFLTGLAGLFIFLSGVALASVLEKPSRFRIILAGAALGGALITLPSAITLIPFGLIIFTVHLSAKISREWEELDPTTRFARYRARSLYYLKNFLAVLGIAAAILYSFYALKIYPHAGIANQTDSKFVSWLAGNYALAPLQHYVVAVIENFKNYNGESWPSIFFYHEPAPLLIILGGALIFSLWQFLRGIKNALWQKSPFSDILGTHFYEFSFLFFIAWYGITTALNGDGAASLIAIIAIAGILAVAALKTWHSEGGKNKLTLNIALTPNIVLRLHLKSLILFALIAWYLTSSLGLVAG